MTFSAAWLALRAPADDRARDTALRARAAASISHSDAPVIVDLGAGAGATWRALAGAVPPGARWRLIDKDADLLAAARRTAERGRGAAGMTADPVGRRQIETDQVETWEVDLADPAAVAEVLADADLITCSAFIDLVSADWLDHLLGVLPPGAAFYAALTYDGREIWRPQTPGDGVILSALHADMRRDKGFGAALGPGAGAALSEALRSVGRTVETADSAWRLQAPRDAALIDALRRGSAGALRAQGAATDALADWETAPRAEALIGHLDHFSPPPAA